jgi:DNA-binding transcriptional regulator YdaS (Cro superfamily)
MNPINKAIKIAGSQTELARLSKISQAAIWKMAKGHSRCSGESAVKIEKALNGAITRHELRPDLFDEVSAA